MARLTELNQVKERETTNKVDKNICDQKNFRSLLDTSIL